MQIYVSKGQDQKKKETSMVSYKYVNEVIMGGDCVNELFYLSYPKRSCT
jgi:hypothetical protein